MGGCKHMQANSKPFFFFFFSFEIYSLYASLSFLHVLWGELEWDLGIVVRCVSMDEKTAVESKQEWTDFNIYLFVCLGR